MYINISREGKQGKGDSFCPAPSPFTALLSEAATLACILDKQATACYNREMKSNRPGLYANINARRKAGTSRSKAKSTISPRIYRMMKAKKGGFAT
jgi:hypothetical protein